MFLMEVERAELENYPLAQLVRTFYDETSKGFIMTSLMFVTGRCSRLIGKMAECSEISEGEVQDVLSRVSSTRFNGATNREQSLKMLREQIDAEFRTDVIGYGPLMGSRPVRNYILLMALAHDNMWRIIENREK